MIKVVGTWELGWNTPIMEYDLWAYMLQDFGADFIMWPVSGIKQPRVVEYNTLEEVLEDNSNLTPVFVDENGEVELGNFEHPEDAIYVLGKASFSPWDAAGKKGLSVRIDLPDSKGGLWPHQAIALILHDRLRKK
jgi:hypothetical protein